MSFSIEAFLEGEIYLDTMMFYVFLRAGEKVRPIIGGFFEHIEKGVFPRLRRVSS